MDIFAFIRTPDPTNVRVVKRERNDDEPRLLDTTVGRTVPLLPVSPDHANSELEASVKRLFDEGQTEKGDSTKGGLDDNIQPVVKAANTVVEDVAPILLHHSGTKVAEAEVDSLIRSSVPIMTTVSTTTSTVDPTLATKKKFVEPSPFGAGSSSASRTDPIICVFLDLIGSDFFVGVIRTVINPDTDLQKVYVLQ
nr:hypothetical protein [Tanacetum cinerariifolium]